MKRVCLDAGHGGTDPGACSSGIKEKEFTLIMVDRIGHYLRAKGIETVFTRDGDEYVAINKRTYIARKNKCNFFLSVHCNAAGSLSAQGVEAFYAAGDLRSSKIANVLIRKISGLTNRGVKADNQSQHVRLGVLRGTYKTMPAILLELGFCTSEHDAVLMNNAKQREKWAEEIAGIIADAI